MSTERQEPPLSTTSMAHTRSESMTKSHSLSNGPLPTNAPIEPGHSLSTGMEMVAGQVEEDHKDSDDDYGHQFVLKRLRKDLPLPGRWTMMGMLYVHLFSRWMGYWLIPWIGSHCFWSCFWQGGTMRVKDRFCLLCRATTMSTTPLVSQQFLKGSGQRKSADCQSLPSGSPTLVDL
jgi:hypothetical protein